MDLLTFFLELSGFILLAFSLFWSVVSVMFHSKFEVPLPAALALGFVLQAVGFALMLVISFAKKSEKKSWNGSLPADPFAASHQISSDPFSFNQSPEFDAAPTYKRRALEPAKIPSLVLVLLGSVLLFVSAPLTWFYSFSADGTETTVGIFSSGLEVWLLFTILALIAGLALSINKWSALSPVLIGYFSAWWFALSLAALSSRLAFINGMSAVFQLPNVIVTSGTGQLSEIVNQRVGDAWLVVLPASILLLSAAYYMAYRYSKSVEAERANFF